MQKSIVWLRQDLRIVDNPALIAAANHGDVCAVYIHESRKNDPWAIGAASCCWLHQSLTALQKQLNELNIPLIIRSGEATHLLQELLKEAKADAVFWNRRYEPKAIASDTMTLKQLRELGYKVQSFKANLLHEPWEITNKQEKPYQVFTPFWKECLKHPQPGQPLLAPKPQQPSIWNLHSLKIEELNLLPKIHWDRGIHAAWQVGTEAGLKQFDQFLEGPVLEYSYQRDFPAADAVSKMSPYLHFGEISPRMLWWRIHSRYQDKKEVAAADSYIRQLYWREFAYHLLYHFPFTPEAPLKSEYAQFPWKSHSDHLQKWQQGRTGYPLVDAGMRQLWQIGWMHNRVRMVVGSFLVKDLLITWQEGAKWFWDTLVDADLANNTLGWQWISGCGADAAPYFRIFHPVTQSEKFDPEGRYIRQWLPELANLPNEWIHCPWLAPKHVLDAAGVCMGKTYPYPVVDHAQARTEALAALAMCKKV